MLHTLNSEWTQITISRLEGREQNLLHYHKHRGPLHVDTSKCQLPRSHSSAHSVISLSHRSHHHPPTLTEITSPGVTPPPLFNSSLTTFMKVWLCVQFAVGRIMCLVARVSTLLWLLHSEWTAMHVSTVLLMLFQCVAFINNTGLSIYAHIRAYVHIFL